MSETPGKAETPKKKKGLLVAAVEAIGTAAGAVASTLGVHETSAPPVNAAPEPRNGKLPPKHKARLPRRLKKAMRAQERRAQENQQPA
jgi:hypothetical protein